MSKNVVLCPSCGRPLDLNKYKSLMVLSLHFALFNLECSFCKKQFSSVEPIPISLFEQVESVAHEVHAGMGKN